MVMINSSTESHLFTTVIGCDDDVLVSKKGAVTTFQL
jgi:hypothetical protein